MHLYERTASDLLAEMATGSLSAVDVVRAFIARSKSKEPHVQAFLRLDESSALAQAEVVDAKRKRGEKLGRLAGIPVAIKDNLCVRGEPTTCASRVLERFCPPYTAHVVERLID